ncbi:MAG: hypothetical protein ACLU94_10260 [Catenibacillus sp.]
MAERLRSSSVLKIFLITLTREYTIEIAVPQSWCGKSIVENSIGRIISIILATKRMENFRFRRGPYFKL